MRRLLAIVLAVALPATALAQSSPGSDAPPPPPPLVAPPTYAPEPPPPAPSYPPTYPSQTSPTPSPNLAPQQVPANLQPYTAINPPPTATKQTSQHEFGLAAAEFFASAGVVLVSTIAVAQAIGNTDNVDQISSTAQIAALLYIGLVPTVSALPVWLIGLLSDTYEPHIGTAVEAGSAISGIALLVYLIGQTDTAKLAAGGLLVVVMPLVEVIAMNLTKTPKGTPYFSLGPPGASPSPLPSVAQRMGIPSTPGEVMLGLPSLRF